MLGHSEGECLRSGTYMFFVVIGFIGGKNSTTLMKQTQEIAMILIGRPHLPSVNGPSMKTTLLLYSMCAKMTAI